MKDSPEAMLEKEVGDLIKKLQKLKGEIGKVIVGQEEVIDQLLIGMLAKGHVLIEGLPGLAKTLLIKTLSEVTSLSFKRIQFTPDLMPTDILGTEVIEETPDHQKSFVFKKGPIFANLVLADEINRTPPKTQSALLEVMQEYRVTNSGTDYDLPQPFFLLATQNPIEQAGTFPLPEAQTDRFLFYIIIGYPSEQEESEILKRTTGTFNENVEAVIDGEEVARLQQLVREVFVSDEIIAYVNRIVRGSRPETSSDDFISGYLSYGAGPRAGQAILLAAKANALISNRFSVVPADIEKVVFPALRHRFVLNFKAEAEKIGRDTIIKRLLERNKV